MHAGSRVWASVLVWQSPALSSSACILGWTLAALLWNNSALGRGSISVMQPGRAARHLEAELPSKARLFSTFSLTRDSCRAGNSPSVLGSRGPVSCLFSVVWEPHFWQSGISLGSALQSSNGFSLVLSQQNEPTPQLRRSWKQTSRFVSIFCFFVFLKWKNCSNNRSPSSSWRAPGLPPSSLTELACLL